MSAVLGRVPVRVFVGLGDDEPVEIGADEIRAVAQLTLNGSRLEMSTELLGVNAAAAVALRRLARRLDPSDHVPTFVEGDPVVIDADAPLEHARARVGVIVAVGRPHTGSGSDHLRATLGPDWFVVSYRDDLGNRRESGIWEAHLGAYKVAI